MFKRIVITIMSVIAGTLLIALLIFHFSSVQGLREYSSIAIYCSIAVALIGGFMFCTITGGPGASDEEYTRLIMAQSHPHIDKADQEDRRHGESLGLVIFVAGVLSGAIGYGLYVLAERGAF